MRTFVLNRKVDKTGISGKGIVAEGVEFSDGTVCLRWLGTMPTTIMHLSIRSVEIIHGHDGATTIEFAPKETLIRS